MLFTFGCLQALAGCTGPSIWEPMVQSNFAYPNSNIMDRQRISLDQNGKLSGGTHAKGIAVRYYPLWAIPKLEDARQTQEAIDQALANGHGEILVDGSYRMESSNAFLFWAVKVTVEGEVYNMTLITRDLGKKPL